jgi:hypothetical protein
MEFDEAKAVMVCGHQGFWWSSYFKVCIACRAEWKEAKRKYEEGQDQYRMDVEVERAILHRSVARLGRQRDRLVGALVHALVYYVPSVSAEAEILSYLNGYNGDEDIMFSTGLLEALAEARSADKAKADTR